MKIFVTGASGVIGRRAVPLLAAAGHRVTAAARSPTRRGALESLGAAAMEASLFDPASLARAVSGNDVVVNLATHLPRGARIILPWAWKENDRVRREGSANLVDAAISAGVRIFVQESFAPVYPDRGDQWIEENVPIQPVAYNQTVGDAEESAERFRGGGRTGIVLRFAAFYGVDAWQTREAIRLARRGWAAMPGAPDAYVSSISHEDAAAAVVAALSAPSGAYNVSDDEPLRRRDLFDTLAGALGVASPKLPPVWMTLFFGSLGEMLARSLRISNRKLREETGWAPKFPSLREGWSAVIAELRRERGGGR